MRALSSSLPLLSSAALLFALSSSFRIRLSSGVSASSRTLCSSRQLKAYQPRFAGVILKTPHFPPPSPGWTNTLRAHSTSSARRAVFGVHAMAGADVAPSIVVYVTVPNKETGTKLAHSIITNKLAACVNQIPGVESTYCWQGKVETDLEVLLIIKTLQALLDELTAHVKANHPYDTPEVIALPITGGSDKYLKWIEDSTQKVQVGQE